MVTAMNDDEMYDVDRDVCAKLVAVLRLELLDVPLLMMIELELVLQRVRHECAPHSCKNHYLAIQMQTICDLNAAVVAKYAYDDDDDDADDDDGQNERSV